MAGYWFGKMVSATLLLQQQLRSILEIVQALQFMATVNFNTIKGFNQSFSSKCPMKSTTMAKGMCVKKLTGTHKISKQARNLIWLISLWFLFYLFIGMYSLIGKVAADHSHKWIYKEPNDQEINFLSAWQNAADSVIISLYVLKIHFMLHFLSEKTSVFLQKYPSCFTAPQDLGSPVPVWYKGIILY